MDDVLSAQNQVSIRVGSLLTRVGDTSGSSAFRSRFSAGFTKFEYVLRQNCEIEVIDYSSVRFNVLKMTNNEFVEMMDTGLNEREPWAKVRWINIGGISWDVMSALAIKYGKMIYEFDHIYRYLLLLHFMNQVCTRLLWRTSFLTKLMRDLRQITILSIFSFAFFVIPSKMTM